MKRYLRYWYLVIKLTLQSLAQLAAKQCGYHGHCQLVYVSHTYKRSVDWFLYKINLTLTEPKFPKVYPGVGQIYWKMTLRQLCIIYYTSQADEQKIQYRKIHFIVTAMSNNSCHSRYAASQIIPGMGCSKVCESDMLCWGVPNPRVYPPPKYSEVNYSACWGPLACVTQCPSQL